MKTEGQQQLTAIYICIVPSLRAASYARKLWLSLSTGWTLPFKQLWFHFPALLLFFYGTNIGMKSLAGRKVVSEKYLMDEGENILPGKSHSQDMKTILFHVAE